jgi:hypothetical protein
VLGAQNCEKPSGKKQQRRASGDAQKIEPGDKVQKCLSEEAIAAKTRTCRRREIVNEDSHHVVARSESLLST